MTPIIKKEFEPAP